ncbi:MAG: PD-(D/E)XK nuclease family protein [Bacteroidales bacterium]|nr:PD-(D/E)XK nuclease family protein [Bacteroidales bacterium]
MMTIYYNPAYSATPYLKKENNVDVGNIYCGNTQLLQRLLFYAGVPYLLESNEERIAYYLTFMQSKVNESSPFYNSFKTDSVGMSRTVLTWRDALVEVGWNARSYEGRSIKLSLLRDIEPEDMPKGEADYWYSLIKLASVGRILPENINVVVTCSKQEVKPHIAHILDKQQKFGVSVVYCADKTQCASRNLGKIQEAIITESKYEIVLDNIDETFHYITFTNEDDALRYVAMEPIDKATVYFCSKPKRFDNTLRLLGKPTIGSSMTSGSPQVVQLFMLGNGLFEYPLNIHRIIEWLNLPINPIDRGLRITLCNALTESGGINNAEWNNAKKDYIASLKDEKEQKKVGKQSEIFLPTPQSGKVDIESVKTFNDNLRKWATMLLAMDEFPYDDIVREQIASIESYCSTLLKMLDNIPAEFTFLDLQLWCKNIAQPSSYSQYDPEVSSHVTIATMGDLHGIADSIVWFPAEDSGVEAYPFEMLNDEEFAEIEKSGAMPYKREHHTLMNQVAMQRILLNTKSLTIIEAEKCNGEKIARHPLVLQLNERIKGGLKSIVQKKSLSDEYTTNDRQVNNQNENPILVELGEQVKLKERHERYEDKAKQAESYSSLSQLIQHPFTYVCERCAKLDDQTMPSAQDLDKTLGNVAHLIVEKVFAGRPIKEACEYYKSEYETIFEESVNEKGLLLRLPEYGIDLRRLKSKMKEVLDKLGKIIVNNSLTVDACEYEFKQAKWLKAGDKVTLGSRADMLLSDKCGGKVIFDFKYSRSKSRKTEVEENRALQLEVYRYMAKQEFGKDTNVRVAYVLLPDVTILTADKFNDIDSIKFKTDRANADVIAEAARSYRFRWEQLKAGKIERVDGCPVGTGEYAGQEVDKSLFPLSVYDKKYSEDKFDNGYKNLK